MVEKVLLAIAALLLLVFVAMLFATNVHADAYDAPDTGDLTIPEYIYENSRYGQRAVCVSRIETGSWTAFYNPIPVGRYGEHAQGYFGWLPSTARSVGVTIMDLDSEIAGFDTMLDLGRGREFYGIARGIC